LSLRATLSDWSDAPPASGATSPDDEVSLMRTRAITVPLLLAAVGAAGATAAQGATPPTRTYKVKLSGSLEVPKGAPHGGGTATLKIGGAKNQVCWTFHLTGIPSPLVSHIHKGAAGVAGPIVIPLGGRFKASGCTTAGRSLIAQIEAAPSKYYVNVHNGPFPNGAARAQL
jgi:hypothetical protein